MTEKTLKAKEKWLRLAERGYLRSRNKRTGREYYYSHYSDLRRIDERIRKAKAEYEALVIKERTPS